MIKIRSDRVKKRFDQYPKSMRNNLLALRELIYEAADQCADVESIEETLKWGQPSYMAENGSTIRLDSIKSTPQSYAIYFYCGTSLVETYRELYRESFRFEGNRAIVFGQDDSIPRAALIHCISLALTYHQVKHLPLLGA